MKEKKCFGSALLLNFFATHPKSDFFAQISKIYNKYKDYQIFFKISTIVIEDIVKHLQKN